EELSDGDLRFAVLRELGPVRADPLVVVEPAPRVRKGQRHRRQALGGRIDDDHRVAFPRVARLSVTNAAPQVDDLFAAEIGATGAAELPTPGEVVGKYVEDTLEPARDLSLNGCGCNRHGARSRVDRCNALAGAMSRCRTPMRFERAESSAEKSAALA